MLVKALLPFNRDSVKYRLHDVAKTIDLVVPKNEFRNREPESLLIYGVLGGGQRNVGRAIVEHCVRRGLVRVRCFELNMEKTKPCL